MSKQMGLEIKQDRIALLKHELLYWTVINKEQCKHTVRHNNPGPFIWKRTQQFITSQRTHSTLDFLLVSKQSQKQWHFKYQRGMGELIHLKLMMPAQQFDSLYLKTEIWFYRQKLCPILQQKT